MSVASPQIQMRWRPLIFHMLQSYFNLTVATWSKAREKSSTVFEKVEINKSQNKFLQCT